MLDKRRQILMLALMLVPFGPALAEEEPLRLDDISGAYRSPVVIRNHIDGVVRTENILEIVKYSPTSAYIRTRLNHPVSGNLCSLWGIAEVEGSHLVYRSVENEDLPSCTLHLTFDKNEILFDEASGQCQVGRCGANVFFSQFGFDRSKRRQITYLNRIPRSRHYQEAVAEYERLLRSRAEKPAPPKQP